MLDLATLIVSLQVHINNNIIITIIVMIMQLVHFVSFRTPLSLRAYDKPVGPMMTTSAILAICAKKEILGSSFGRLMTTLPTLSTIRYRS